jgi:hypothetical protein
VPLSLEWMHLGQTPDSAPLFGGAKECLVVRHRKVRRDIGDHLQSLVSPRGWRTVWPHAARCHGIRQITIFLAFCHHAVENATEVRTSCLLNRKIQGTLRIWVRSDMFGAGKPTPALGFPPNSLQQRSGLFRCRTGRDQGRTGNLWEAQGVCFAAIRDRVSSLYLCGVE